MQLTSLLHLVLKLRLHGAVREFPFCLHSVVLVQHEDISTIYESLTEDNPCTVVPYSICVGIERYLPQCL